jgi:hypothetical protein
VVNEASHQATKLSQFSKRGRRPAGADPAVFDDFRNVSQVYATAIFVTMKDITPSANPLHLEHAFGGVVFFCPQGVDIGTNT